MASMCNKSNLKCCYKQCKNGVTLDARIEVKTVLPKPNILRKVNTQLLVEWDKNGEAEFHAECWYKVCALSR